MNKRRNKKEFKKEKRRIEEFRSLLPDDLNFGEFEADFKMDDGRHYKYGAWNSDGVPILAWNTRDELVISWNSNFSMGYEG